MKDGTAEFKTVDARVAAIFDLIYPIGSVFATTGSAPNLGTWEEIAQGRTLQGADGNHAAGSTVEAGLPNITGTAGYDRGGKQAYPHGIGAFREYFQVYPEDQAYSFVFGKHDSEGQDGYAGWTFDASRSDPIYGNSTTVQPPAYIVHFYRRIA